MQAVLALLGQVLSRVLEILGIAQVIQGFATHSAQEREQYVIEDIVTNAQLAIQNPTYGLSAIHTDLADLHTDVGLLATAISALSTQVGSPVQTTAAPSWYGTPPSAGTIAYEVWTYVLTSNTLLSDSASVDAGTMLLNANILSQFGLGWQGIPLANNPFFAYLTTPPWAWDDNYMRYYFQSNVDFPGPPDWSLWEAGDTVLSFMQKQDTGSYLGWSGVAPNGWTGNDVAYLLVNQASGRKRYLRTNFTALDMRILAAAETPPDVEPPTITLPPVAPIWPGSAGVTLGDPVALTSNLTLTEALDGVIVTITTPPTRTGQYLLGGRTLYYGMGRVAFIDDSGHAEQWQYLSWASEIITPKTMAHASGAVFQVLGGAEGTVTPWVVSEGA